MRYNLTVGFETSRELTEYELGNLQMDCIAQIDDPMIEGERVDFRTIILGSDVDKVELTSEEFCHELAEYLKGYDVKHEIAYSGGGIWLVCVPLGDACYLQAGDGGAVLCDRETDADLAIVSLITEPKDLALFIHNFVKLQ